MTFINKKYDQDVETVIPNKVINFIKSIYILMLSDMCTLLTFSIITKKKSFDLLKDNLNKTLNKKKESYITSLYVLKLTYSEYS